MGDLLAVPGAFRGAWYWEPLSAELDPHGHRLVAVELTGTGSRARPRPADVALDDWIHDVVAAADRGESDRIVLVGHSMGGVVAQAAAGALGTRVDRLVLLDSPLVRVGQRAIDVSGPTPPDHQLPDRSAWIEPRPVGPDDGFIEPALAAWVNERLCAVPMGPQLDPVGELGDPVTSLVFFDRTPDHFPSALARRQCLDRGRPVTSLDAHHDAPVLHPVAVAELLAALLHD